MTVKKSIILWGFIILLIGVCFAAFTTPTCAETMKYKAYTYSAKTERVLIGDVEGHALGLAVRRGILVFENGENGTELQVVTSDQVKGTGPILLYATITFTDGSTIIVKSQGALGGTALAATTTSESTGEIVKGTGRFEGIRGTYTRRQKYFPLEKGEDAPKGIGEGIITYTLPSK